MTRGTCLLPPLPPGEGRGEGVQSVVGWVRRLGTLIPAFSRGEKGKHSPVLMAVVSVALLGACAPLPPDHPPVPPSRAEQVPVPPRSNVTLIWRPGHYDWNGSGYTWIPGEWIDRAGRSSLWQDGYWRQVSGRSVWVPAHWL